MNSVKRPKWRTLSAWLFALSVLAVLAVAWFSVVTYLSGHSAYSLWMYLPETYEIKPGAMVTIAGVRVGRVESVRLVSPAVEALQDPRRTVVVKLRITRKDGPFIRSDSTATLKTQGLLGDQYVDISRGFVGQPLGEAGELAFQPPQTIGLRKIVNRIIPSTPKESCSSKSESH